MMNSGDNAENSVPISHNLNDETLANKVLSPERHVQSPLADELSQMRDDQRQALSELEYRNSMNVETEEDVEQYLASAGEPPHYDVREKLEEYNRKWDVDAERGPSPPSRRSSKVGFKENLVDMLEPPSLSDDENEDTIAAVEDTEAAAANEIPPEVTPNNVEDEEIMEEIPDKDLPHHHSESERLEFNRVPHHSPTHQHHHPHEDAPHREKPASPPSTPVQGDRMVGGAEEHSEHLEDTSRDKEEQEKAQSDVINQKEEEETWPKEPQEVHARHDNTPPQDDSEDKGELEKKLKEDQPQEHDHSDRGEENQNDLRKESPPEEPLGEQVLVERDGKFILMSPGAIEAEEKPLTLEKPSARSDTEPRRDTNDNLQKRSQSAPVRRPPTSKSNVNWSTEYRSRYALTPEEKARKRRLDQLKEEERRREEQRKKEEEEKRHQENEQAFQAWLAKKDKETRARRESEAKQHQPTEEEKREREKRNKELFEQWKIDKKKQQEEEKKLKMAEERELKALETHHTEEERRKAYKQWLHRKALEKELREKEERQRAKITRLALRKSRRSRALAAALERANTLGYTDYYGYRS